MKKCGRCGAGNEDGAALCSLCGERFPGLGWESGVDTYRAPGEVGTPTGNAKSTSNTTKSKTRSLALKICIPAGIVLIAAAAVFGVRYVRRPPAPVPSAAEAQTIDLSREPIQEETDDKQPLYSGPEGIQVVPLARYSISARVLCVLVNRKYGDKESVFPLDLALAWGNVATSDYDEYLSYKHDRDWLYNQWLHWRIDEEKLPAGVTDGYIASHISNNHVRPATENIYNAIVRLKSGESVLLEGYLAEGTYPDGHKMGSSMSRSDTEAGACESFYVTRIQIGDTVHE